MQFTIIDLFSLYVFQFNPCDFKPSRTVSLPVRVSEKQILLKTPLILIVLSLYSDNHGKCSSELHRKRDEITNMSPEDIMRIIEPNLGDTARSHL